LPKKPRTPPPPRPVQAPQRRASPGRSAEDQRRIKMLMAFAVSGLVGLAAVVALILFTTGGKAGGDQDVAAAMKTAGCTLTTAVAKSRKHVTSLDEKVEYNTDPPSNGNHYFQPAFWDFYTTAANPIQVVHNEEHGGVILWWGDKVPEATVEKLRDFYNESPNSMLGTPYAKLGNKVAITAWTAPAGENGEGHVAVCSTFNEKAFAAFRDAYRGKGPERYPVDAQTPGT
jgi:Protein of unknown function (DUF3105)